jgi:hypothetical protein
LPGPSLNEIFVLFKLLLVTNEWPESRREDKS